MVTVDGGTEHVLAGLSGLVVLKTTGSEFWGFPRDRYTTLAETRDRILATAVTARWRYTRTDLDFAARFAGVRGALLEAFAAHPLAGAAAVAATRWATAVLERFAEVAEVRMSMPNKHHFLQDLSAFGLDNPDVVYHADDRPYGLIEGTVRAGRRPAGRGRLAGHARLLLSARLAAPATPTPPNSTRARAPAGRPRARPWCAATAPSAPIPPTPRNCHQTRQSARHLHRRRRP